MPSFLLPRLKLAFVKSLFIVLILFFELATQKTFAQSWNQMGPELSTSSTTFCSVATDYDGSKTIPYIAYVESSKVKVKRLINNVWEDLGFVSGGNASYPYLAIGANRAIWVAYKNDSTSVGGTFAIKQYNGTNWIVKGQLNLSPGNISTNSSVNNSANRCNITICDGGVPYIVYSDYSNSASTLYGNAYVKKYDSFTNTWSLVGQGSVKSTGSRSVSASLAFDTNHNLYVAYADGLDAGNPNVLKYDSYTDTWLNISTTGTSTSARNCGIAINKNNTIFLSYLDLNKQKASLLKYDNTSAWATLGDVNGFSTGTTTANTVKTDAVGNAFVYYIDKASSVSGVDYQRSVVKKWAVNSANTDPLTEINSTPVPTPNGFGEGTISGSLSVGINNLLYSGLIIPSSVSSGVNTPRLKVSGTESAFNGYFISKQSGDFNASTTWVIYPTNANISSLTPSSNDGVVIESGHTVTLKANQSVKNITIENGAQLLSDGTLRTLTMGTNLAADSLSFIKNDGELGSTLITGADKIDLVVDNISNVNSTTFTLSGIGISKLNSFKITKNASVALPQIKKVTANMNQNLNISAASVSFSAIPSVPAINEDYTINVAANNTVLMTSTTAQFNASVAPQAASGSGTYTYNIFGTIDCSASTQNFGIVPMPNNPSSTVTLNIKSGGKFMSGLLLQLKNTGTTAGLYDNQGKVFLNVDGEADLTKITANVNSNITAYWNLTSTGVVRRAVTGAASPLPFTFPVGTSTGYSPVSIKNTGTTGVFSVRVNNDFSSTPLQDPTTSVNQKWTVTAENAASVISELRLGWLAIQEGSAFGTSRGISKINYFDGASSTWKSIDNTTTTVPTTTAAMYNTNSNLPNTYIATLAPTPSTSGTIPLSASFAVIVPSTLPLNLVYFNAILNGFMGSKYVSLSWISTNEINTKSFLIERQTDQNTFETIGEIISKNKAGEHNYTYTDNYPASGVSYYRLKMVDQDGKFTISDIKAIKNESNVGITWFPNPVKDKLTIIYPQAKNASTIQIWSLTGKQIIAIPVSINSQQSIIDVSDLQPGTYIILFKDIKEQVPIKFIKI